MQTTPSLKEITRALIFIKLAIRAGNSGREEESKKVRK